MKYSLVSPPPPFFFFLFSFPPHLEWNLGLFFSFSCDCRQVEKAESPRSPPFFFYAPPFFSPFSPPWFPRMRKKRSICVRLSPSFLSHRLTRWISRPFFLFSFFFIAPLVFLQPQIRKGKKKEGPPSALLVPPFFFLTTVFKGYWSLELFFFFPPPSSFSRIIKNKEVMPVFPSLPPPLPLLG